MIRPALGRAVALFGGLALASCSAAAPAPPPPTVTIAAPAPPPAAPCPSASAVTPASVATVSVDIPKASDFAQPQYILSIDISAGGTISSEGRPIRDDDELRAIARQAKGANPDLRAVIRADANAKHGRVIHALDLLKQEGITKIAFGVAMTAHP